MIALLSITGFLGITVAVLVLEALAEFVVALHAVPHHEMLPIRGRLGRGRLA